MGGPAPIITSFRPLKCNSFAYPILSTSSASLPPMSQVPWMTRSLLAITVLADTPIAPMRSQSPKCAVISLSAPAGRRIRPLAYPVHTAGSVRLTVADGAAQLNHLMELHVKTLPHVGYASGSYSYKRNNTIVLFDFDSLSPAARLTTPQTDGVRFAALGGKSSQTAVIDRPFPSP